MKKRFHRSKNKKILGGVFGGLEELVGIEARFLRWAPFIATIIIYVLFGGEVMLFFILAIILLYAGYWFSVPAK